jgi:glutamine amidotransferase
VATLSVIDYGMGNLRSVTKAIGHVGGVARLVRRPEEVRESPGLVLPGVGAFSDCMSALQAQGLVEPIREHVAAGRPFLGICLGYQALFDTSEEAPGVPGLGIVPGEVRRFPSDAGLKIPHMGWNRMIKRVQECPLLDGIEDGSHVYFVHSYYCAPSDPSWVAVEADYGVRFAAMIWRDRLFATQFHPEKSQKIGLRMLRRFVEISA